MIRENESADGKERAENASSAPSPSASLEATAYLTFNRDVEGPSARLDQLLLV